MLEVYLPHPGQVPSNPYDDLLYSNLFSVCVCVCLSEPSNKSHKVQEEDILDFKVLF